MRRHASVSRQWPSDAINHPSHLRQHTAASRQWQYLLLFGWGRPDMRMYSNKHHPEVGRYQLHCICLSLRVCIASCFAILSALQVALLYLLSALHVALLSLLSALQVALLSLLAALQVALLSSVLFLPIQEVFSSRLCWAAV